MATKTVGKGAGRPAAERRSAKHAQRTELPPKPGAVAAAKEPIEVPVWPGRKRCEVCSEVLTARGLPRHLKAHAERGEKAPDSTPAAPEEPAPTDAQTKAHRNAPTFLQAGWAVTVQVSGDYAELIAERDTETIHQAWVGGVFQPQVSTYTIGDRTVKPRNVAEAIRWAKRSPAAAEAEFSKVSSNRAFVKREPSEAPKPAKLPWEDPETVPEKDLVDALAGAKIKWHNRLTQEPEVAIVDRDPHRIRIVTQHGHRVALFLCMNSGYRAARVSAILSVGKASAAQLADMEVRSMKAKAKAAGRKRIVTAEEE